MFKKRDVSDGFVFSLVVLVIACASLFCGMIFLDYDMVETVSVDGMNLNRGEVLFTVDSVKEGGKYIQIFGWSIKPGKRIAVIHNYLLLKDLTENRYLKLNTSMENRVDLNRAFKDGRDYSKGGFFAVVNKRHLNMEHRYEIYIWYTTMDSDGENNILVPTGHLLDQENDL